VKRTPLVFFLKELKRVYPEFSFKIVKTPVPTIHSSDQPLYGYSHRESIKINGKGVGIEWLPHINDMAEEQLEYILERCKCEVEKLKSNTKKKNHRQRAIKSYKKNTISLPNTASAST